MNYVFEECNTKEIEITKMRLEHLHREKNSIDRERIQFDCKSSLVIKSSKERSYREELLNLREITILNDIFEYSHLLSKLEKRSNQK